MTELLTGDGSFSFTARIDGDDIVVENVVSTWFGGTNDPGDDGQTASGVVTAVDPPPPGCALPMDGCNHSATNGSPIPKLPYLTTHVTVTNRANGRAITVPLIDLGPSKYAKSHAAIDLTPTSFQALGGDLNGANLRVNYRILGAGKYVQDQRPPSASIRRSLASAAGTAPSIPAAASDGTSLGVLKPDIKAYIESPYHRSRNGNAVDTIILHYTTGSTVDGTISWFLNNPDQVSAHYVVDRNGDIYQMVKEDLVANHCRGANLTSIGIEHVAVKGQQLSNVQSDATVALIRWLLAAFHLDKSAITGHRFAKHYTGTGTDCPDSLFGDATEAALKAWIDANFT